MEGWNEPLHHHGRIDHLVNAPSSIVKTLCGSDMKARLPKKFMNVSNVKVSPEDGVLSRSMTCETIENHDKANLDTSCYQRHCVFILCIQTRLVFSHCFFLGRCGGLRVRGRPSHIFSNWVLRGSLGCATLVLHQFGSQTILHLTGTGQGNCCSPSRRPAQSNLLDGVRKNGSRLEKRTMDPCAVRRKWQH